jgi:hypothetical protein
VQAVVLEGLAEGELVVIGDKPAADTTRQRMGGMGPMPMPRMR